MGYSFRIHIEVSGHTRLNIDEPQHELTSDGAVPRVVLTTESERSIVTAETLFLIGGSYQSRDKAEDEAARWRVALQGSFAKLQVGADFGDRVPREPDQMPAHQLMSANTGARAVAGHHGTIVFEDDPFPRFNTLQAGAVRPVPPDQLATALKGALAAPRTTPMPNDEAAYVLFSASFFESNPEARIILLTSAIEAFHGNQRSGPITRTLENFVATKLPNGQYGGMSSGDFFIYCYNVRGDIVHGQASRLDRAGVTLAADHLERMVADLLSEPFPAG
ncbi:hypothetical protein [Nocardia bovistercoris]|uniref:Apea-like HEPN domain-containing protein n=1 Tax=Nocardia bovistercoris TaxID=2785916 RepID=A0A931IKK9_9NOCA|nr:hypothetical protein [Nocardia bovistercoris]MBH0781345.1 hypothetical protein [Nocardia bovistercoris]